MKLNIYKSISTLIITILLSAFSVQSLAQEKAQIFGMAGYLTNSHVTVALGELKFKDGVSYGLGFDIPVDRNMKAEISWSMSPSQANLDQYTGGEILITDMVIHTFQVGALIEPKKQKASAFGLITLGASLFYPTGSNYEAEWLFSFALGGGVNIDVSDKVGIRLQAKLVVPMQFAGTSVWFGTGGAGVSVGAYSSFVQGDFSGGLFYRI